jgi:hypothetical protein
MILFTMDSALGLIKRVLSVDDTAYDEIENFRDSLEIYSGLINTTQVFYRPYYVIALTLWTDLSNNLISGEGAKFDQNIETSRRFLTLQQRLDKASSAVINPEFECYKLLSVIAGETVTPVKTEVGFISF